MAEPLEERLRKILAYVVLLPSLFLSLWVYSEAYTYAEKYPTTRHLANANLILISILNIVLLVILLIYPLYNRSIFPCDRFSRFNLFSSYVFFLLPVIAHQMIIQEIYQTGTQWMVLELYVVGGYMWWSLITGWVMAFNVRYIYSNIKSRTPYYIFITGAFVLFYFTYQILLFISRMHF